MGWGGLEWGGGINVLTTTSLISFDKTCNEVTCKTLLMLCCQHAEVNGIQTGWGGARGLRAGDHVLDILLTRHGK